MSCIYYSNEEVEIKTPYTQYAKFKGLEISIFDIESIVIDDNFNVVGLETKAKKIEQNKLKFKEEYMNISELIKTKSFWAGIPVVLLGIYTIVANVAGFPINGNIETAIAELCIGLSVIFVRNAVGKIK